MQDDGMSQLMAYWTSSDSSTVFATNILMSTLSEKGRTPRKSHGFELSHNQMCSGITLFPPLQVDRGKTESLPFHLIFFSPKIVLLNLISQGPEDPLSH